MSDSTFPSDGGGILRSSWMALASGALLSLCWALGGVTSDATPADEVLQLFALPLLAVAAWRVLRGPTQPAQRFALCIAFVMALVPLWQLLPLPLGLGGAGAARMELAADLTSAGVGVPDMRASLWPRATEHALWSLLPALALFLAGLSLRDTLRRRMLQVILSLALASAAFALFQLSLPDGSPMLLYTTWGRNFGGFFINPNHQGTALSLGAAIALALFLDARHRAREGREVGIHHWLYALAVAACVVMVPFANGSAAVLLAVVGLVAVVAMGGMRRSGQRGRGAFFLRVAGLALAVLVVLVSAISWKQVDVDRQRIAQATVEIGGRFAPLGAGVGSFVPVFAQSQHPHDASGEVVNHAHSEYAQWWLEGGVPGLIVVLVFLAWFAWSGWTLLARMQSHRLRAIAAPAWTGLLILLLHSLVDFPLRTPALMATGGLLAGLLVATLAEARGRRQPDDVMQKA